ncbi:MAG TPA: endonuclease/exonuclease/phosphatase family protein [Tepidisphaeraceae bacterium]
MAAGLLALSAAATAASGTTTGTFVDRELPTDVRVATYNVLNDNIFADTNPTRAARFARIAPSINADVWVLQEVQSHNATDVRTLFNTIAPLPGGASWNVFHSSFEYAIVSRYPLSMTLSDITPAGPKATGTALVNLPDATYAKDLYLMDVHFKAFSGTNEQQERQDHADAVVNWQRDARTAGGNVNLPNGTPMVALGDLNLVDGPQPRDTLITGNIINNATYSADSPPDWDGTANTDAAPVHNSTGTTNYTWRDDGSSFAPSRLDHVIYTDSAIAAPHSFVLNTVSMTAADLSATGMQQFDVTLDNTGHDFDHLPVIVDFRMNGGRTLVWNALNSTWNTSSSNWLNGAASAIFASGDIVRFTSTAVGTVTIQAGGVTPAAVIINNTSGTYRFIGPGGINGSAALTKSGTGTAILSTANTFTGGTTVAAGTLIIDHSDALGFGPLAINSTGRVKSTAGLASAIRVSSLSIATGGSMDLADDDLVLDYTGTSPAAIVRAMLIDGRLSSSLANASRRLGYGENSTLAFTNFSNRPVDSTTLLIKYTYLGDANLDGVVDAADLGLLAMHWQTSGVWTDGDFNYSGFVDVNDLSLLASNWQAGIGTPLSSPLGDALAALGLPPPVPEPSSISLIALTAALASPRRRRTF